MAWLPPTSATVAPALLAMMRCAPIGIIWSSLTRRYQEGLVFHAGSVIAPLTAATPHGTCEAAMNAALSGLTSAAKDAGNFARSSKRNPSFGPWIGGTGAPGGGSLMSEPTDSPRSGANAVI